MEKNTVDEYFYNCSKQYIDSIHPELYSGLIQTIGRVVRRNTQAEINRDLFWLLTDQGWSYDSLPGKIDTKPSADLHSRDLKINEIVVRNRRELCITTNTLKAKWHSDYANLINNKLVQLEVQFGKVESMFKDFCGFRIAYYEKRLSLGIEIVMSEPNVYFAKHKSAITGMAYFNIAKETLPAIGLDCPIFLIGIRP